MAALPDDLLPLLSLNGPAPATDTLTVIDSSDGRMVGADALNYLRALGERLERAGSIEVVGLTTAGERCVAELAGGTDATPVQTAAVVVVRAAEGSVAEVRTYSQRAAEAPRSPAGPVRSVPQSAATPGGVVGDYLAAVEREDIEDALACFEPDDCSITEPDGTVHVGLPRLRSFYEWFFSIDPGGRKLEICAVTDDGIRCALEWCSVLTEASPLPQSGLAVYERAATGRLRSFRLYTDRPAALGAPDFTSG